MRLPSVALSLFVVATAITGVSAEAGPDPAMRWIAKTILASPSGRQITLEVTERQMLRVFKTMNIGVPRFNGLALQLDQTNRPPRQRAQAIARFLEKDLDNDGRVTTDELKTFLEPQSRTMLRSTTGLEIEPTTEQTDQIMQQLLAQNLQADASGDGTIDFDEMRAAAVQTTNPSTRISTIRLVDPQVTKLLDTSGDKIVSHEEFLSAVRKTFAAIDSDKNGVIDATEVHCADVMYVNRSGFGTPTCF